MSAVVSEGHCVDKARLEADEVSNRPLHDSVICRRICRTWHLAQNYCLICVLMSAGLHFTYPQDRAKAAAEAEAEELRVNADGLDLHRLVHHRQSDEGPDPI